MKHEYYAVPEQMKPLQSWGFNWLEFVTSVPSPLFLVTTYKSNGKPNACMQSWASFTTGDNAGRFFALLSSVNRSGHLYRTLHERNCAVINFMSADYFDKAMATIRHNDPESDELAESGLTAVPARKVDAPMAEECFMNLECRFAWEKELVPGDSHAVICLEIVNVHVDEAHLDSRAGENGILYNIHHPINPEAFTGRAHDYAGVIKPVIDMGEY